MKNLNLPLVEKNKDAVLYLPPSFYGATRQDFLNVPVVTSLIVAAVLIVGISLGQLNGRSVHPSILFVGSVVIMGCLVAMLVQGFKISRLNAAAYVEARTSYLKTVFIPWVAERYGIELTLPQAANLLQGEIVYLSQENVNIGLMRTLEGYLYLDDVKDLNSWRAKHRSSFSTTAAGDAGMVYMGSEVYSEGSPFYSDSFSDGSSSDGSSSGDSGGGGDGGGGDGGGD